jgi:hypothetical protein
VAKNEVDGNAVGLDVGTSRVVAAQQSGGDEFQYNTQLNAFVTIPYSKLTENVLKKEHIPHNIQGSEIVVHGNESERFADLLGVETRRPMTKGVLNPTEPDSLNVMRQIISSLVARPKKEKAKVCFSVPAAPLGADENLTYHEATLKQILGEMNYDVKAINEGLAVIYGELEASNYTGIGISCGGGLCNVCLAYLSVPVLSFSVSKAGDFIDSSTASITGELANRIRLLKEESFHLNGAHPDKLQQVMGVYYDDMIQTLVNGLRDAFLSSKNMPKLGRPIPLVLSGGTALPKGFRDRFEKLLRTQDFPIALSEIRTAESPLYSTAKGALVCALSEM